MLLRCCHTNTCAASIRGGVRVGEMAICYPFLSIPPFLQLTAAILTRTRWMLVALVVLNAIYLICSLLFNAELLNMAGADIPLKKLEALELFSQLLASTSMCLLVWRLC